VSIEEHSRRDVKNPVDVSNNQQEVRSREECIKSVASDYISTFPNLSFADINEPQVLLTLLHQLGVFLRDQKFDFHQPYQLEEKTLESDARAALKYTKYRETHVLSEGEIQQRLNGWAGEMVVKFLLDVVYECARRKGVPNAPYRHHHNERKVFFPREVTSAFNVHVGAQLGSGRQIRFDHPGSDKSRKHTERVEVDLFGIGGEGKFFFIDVTTSLRLVEEKLRQKPDSPIAHLRQDLAATRRTAYNIVCAVTDKNMSPVLSQDHEGNNYAGTVPVRHEVQKFADRYFELLNNQK
jgi:hypothetical protein